MRIAFTGSGGTGKTTLLNAVNLYLNFPIIDEGIRPWLENNGFDEFKEMDINDVQRMQDEVMYAKINEETPLKEFISDRTTIDNAMYTLRWVSSLTNEYDGWYSKYLEDARKHTMLFYDIIFVLPHGAIHIENDGIRSSKTWYQFLMQQLIEKEIDAFSTLCYPHTHKIKSLSVEDRVNECLMVYNDIKLKGRAFIS